MWNVHVIFTHFLALLSAVAPSQPFRFVTKASTHRYQCPSPPPSHLALQAGARLHADAALSAPCGHFALLAGRAPQLALVAAPGGQRGPDDQSWHVDLSMAGVATDQFR